MASPIGTPNSKENDKALNKKSIALRQRILSPLHIVPYSRQKQRWSASAREKFHRRTEACMGMHALHSLTKDTQNVTECVQPWPGALKERTCVPGYSDRMQLMLLLADSSLLCYFRVVCCDNGALRVLAHSNHIVQGLPRRRVRSSVATMRKRDMVQVIFRKGSRLVARIFCRWTAEGLLIAAVTMRVSAPMVQKRVLKELLGEGEIVVNSLHVGQPVIAMPSLCIEECFGGGSTFLLIEWQTFLSRTKAAGSISTEQHWGDWCCHAS